MRLGSGLIRHGASATSRYVAIAIVVAAPVPFGSIDQPWPAVWSGLMGLSLLFADPVRLPGHVKHVLLVLCALVAAWLLVLLLQGDRDPGPELAFDWPEGAGAPTSGAPHVSASRQNPFLAAGPALLMALTFGRFALLGTEKGGAEQTLRAIRLGAVATGLISLVLFVVDPGHLLGRTKVYYLGNFTGTFVNRNTAAAFFGTACLLWASHLRDIVPSSRPGGWGTVVGTVMQITDRLSGPVMVCTLAAVLCLGLAAMTGSRAGFVLTAVLLVPVMTWTGRRRRRRSGAIVKAAAFAGIVAIVLVVGGLVGSRLSMSGPIDSYRWEVYRLCLTLVEQHPWLGIGLGNFETVFPAVRTPAMGMRGVWEFSHSTPLELAVEVGWPLALATGLAWIAAAVWMLRAGRDPRMSRTRRPALAVFVFGAAHSLIDFPLQVPGYAIVFAAVVGCGVARSSTSQDLPFGNTQSSA